MFIGLHPDFSLRSGLGGVNIVFLKRAASENIRCIRIVECIGNSILACMCRASVVEGIIHSMSVSIVVVIITHIGQIISFFL